MKYYKTVGCGASLYSTCTYRRKHTFLFSILLHVFILADVYNKDHTVWNMLHNHSIFSAHTKISSSLCTQMSCHVKCERYIWDLRQLCQCFGKTSLKHCPFPTYKLHFCLLKNEQSTRKHKKGGVAYVFTCYMLFFEGVILAEFFPIFKMFLVVFTLMYLFIFIRECSREVTGNEGSEGGVKTCNNVIKTHHRFLFFKQTNERTSVWASRGLIRED